MERTSEFSIHQHFSERQRGSKNGLIFEGWVRRPNQHTQSPQFASLPSLVFTLALMDSPRGDGLDFRAGLC